MNKRIFTLFLISIMCGSFCAFCADKPGEKLKGKITFDKRLELTISQAGKAQPPRTRMFDAKFTNKSADTIRFYFEGCKICFWSISINHGEFIPMDCAKHTSMGQCPYRNLIELEPGQSAIKMVVWEAYPKCNTKKTYNEPIKSVRIRYLLKRESVPAVVPAVYIESNDLLLD